MNKILFIILATFLFSACNKKSNDLKNTDLQNEFTVKGQSDGFVMYEMSEMANLMEQMYVENKRLRDRIISNDTLGIMPEYFDGILNKKLTDPSDLDKFYLDHAKIFLAEQKKIYANPDNAKEMFNASITACIKCHEVKCGGPIQRIKTLYID